jgi:arylsulfatase A-like enzyme
MPEQNVVLITVDQERYFAEWPDGLELPARQRLMDMGVTFDRHYIASAVCTPSRSVMYTGRHVPHTRMFDNSNFPFVPPMSTDIPTVGHMLRELGYHTAYKGKWHLNLGLEPDPDRDHDYTDDMEQYGFSDFNSAGDCYGGLLDGFKYDGRTAEDAVTWLRSKGLSLSAEGSPWFLAVNFVNPHDIMYFVPGQDRGPGQGGFPTISTAPDTPMYSTTYDVPPPASHTQPIDEEGRPQAHAETWGVQVNLLGRVGPAEEDWRAFQDYYFNCMRNVDARIGTVLDDLEALGFLENTAIVFTSDHGEIGGAHGLWSKGGFAYEENCHVPLVAYVPGGPAGVRCNAVTSHVDLAPTLVGLSGAGDEEMLRVTSDLPGKDLVPLLDDPVAASTDAVREGALFTYNHVITLDDEFLMTVGRLQKSGATREEVKEAVAPDFEKRGFTRTVIDGRCKYTRYFAPTKHNRPETLAEILSANDIELFDTVRDPGEMVNLAAHPEKHKTLILEMNAKLNRLIDAEIGTDDGAYLPGHDDTDWYVEDFDHG